MDKSVVYNFKYHKKHEGSKVGDTFFSGPGVDMETIRMFLGIDIFGNKVGVVGYIGPKFDTGEVPLIYRHAEEMLLCVDLVEITTIIKETEKVVKIEDYVI